MRQQVAQAHLLDAHSSASPLVARLVDDDAHAQRQRAANSGRRLQPDDAQRLAGHPGADERRRLPPPALETLVGAGDAARHGQRSTMVISAAAMAGAPGGAVTSTPCGGCVDIDVGAAGTGAGDDAQVRRCARTAG